MRGPWGPQIDILDFVRVVLVVIYLFHASWGLNHLDFSGYIKIIYPKASKIFELQMWNTKNQAHIEKNPKSIFDIFLNNIFGISIKFRIK
jgi:hypothetical protein